LAQADYNPAHNLRIGETRSGAPAVLFDFPFDDDLNDAVKGLPGRLFDWERRVWVVPIDQPLARQVNEILGRHRNLTVDPEIAEWLEAIDGWEGEVTVDEVGGAPYFAVSTLHGDEPEAFAAAERDDQEQALLPFSSEIAKVLLDTHGAYLDGRAQASARALAAGRNASAATLGVGTDDEGEQRFELELTWGFSVRESFLRLPQAQSSAWEEGSYYADSAVEVLTVPADAALMPALDDWLGEHPAIGMDAEAEQLIDELREEYENFESTVELSRAHDAPLDVLRLGGELHPFQRAGVVYALQQRRTFIADEQGLGKTVQALATLEAADAYPAVVVCPASIKLNWRRETEKWLPHRSVAVVSGRSAKVWEADPELAGADITILNYEIVSAHEKRLSSRGLEAAVFDESHYCKAPRAQRTKAAIALSESVSRTGLRLALTGTPVLNRPKELISQLRLLGRLKDFGSGAGFERRFEDDRGHTRLHWHLRARCYVRRRKEDVLPQLPPKRHETIHVELSNASEYSVAERDVISWLMQQKGSRSERDAKIAAAMRAERLAQLNALRILAGRGKIAAAVSWVEDWLETGEPLVIFADHVEVQKALVSRFPDALHILGNDSITARQAAIDAFQKPGGPLLIVCSIRAAGHGVTLTRASNVAFVELDWTPARLEQAEDRLHRIGQRDSVTAWYLLAPDTIDATMAAVIDMKRQVIGAVTDGRVEDEGALMDAVVNELIRRREAKPADF
jgi:hypothetical protein